MTAAFFSLVASSKVAHTSIQWVTLLWVVGAVLVAGLVITVIVVLSRRPKSMEDGIEEFSRSLQAVAPSHRATGHPNAGHAPLPVAPKGQHSSNASSDAPHGAVRRETEAV
ncbi:MAG: hypothetical protein ACP5VR_03020 [Acidimicrobiales bacterium]